MALITNAEMPNTDIGDKLSPNHCANPLLAIVAAKLKPPPNKIRTPHGKRSRLDHIINCFCCLSPLGIKNRRRAPPSAMAVSDNPWIDSPALRGRRKIHPNTTKPKIMATRFSGTVIFPSASLSSRRCTAAALLA